MFRAHSASLVFAEGKVLGNATALGFDWINGKLGRVYMYDVGGACEPFRLVNRLVEFFLAFRRMYVCGFSECKILFLSLRGRENDTMADAREH